MMVKEKYLYPCIVALYAIAMLYSVLLGLTHPNRNWDMICYLGSVVSWQEKTPETIYSTSMGIVKDTMPDWLYQQFIENPLSSSPAAYIQQLPFCQVKPLYNVSMWFFHQTGMALTTASWVTSTVSFAILAILLFLWRPHCMGRSAWLLMVLALAFFWEDWPFATLARFSTPDALCTMLCIAALFAWLERKSFRYFCLFGLLATLARPDSIIPLGIYTAYFATLAPKPQRAPLFDAVFFCALLLISNVVVKHITQGPNYTYEHFYIYSFFNKNPNPATMSDHLTFDMYWQSFTVGLKDFFTLPRTIMLVIISLAGGFSYYMRPAPGKANRLWLDLLLVTWGAWAVRFILWPAALENRFYYGYCLVILFASGELIAPFTASAWKILQTFRKQLNS